MTCTECPNTIHPERLAAIPQRRHLFGIVLLPASASLPARSGAHAKPCESAVHPQSRKISASLPAQPRRSADGES